MLFLWVCFRVIFVSICLYFITSAIFVSVVLFPPPFVCLLWGQLKKICADFHSVWEIGKLWTKEELIDPEQILDILFIDNPAVDWLKSESKLGKTSYGAVRESGGRMRSVECRLVWKSVSSFLRRIAVAKCKSQAQCKYVSTGIVVWRTTAVFDLALTTCRCCPPVLWTTRVPR